MINTRISRVQLLAGAALFAMTAQSALAQTTQDALPAQTAPTDTTPSTGDQADNAGGDIVVTGTLFRRTDTETPSPVTVLSSETLQQRGIQTAAEAIQRLSANNAGALPNNFTAGGAFAAGASAVSLRGLTTSSTLVLFDGLRAAYYPLADDGTRNFVDLNTIPDAIIDRIEVVKDGASSTYGADAVAGVVNIITKKQFTGIAGRAEAGISERGDAGNQRLSLTAGYGDLDEQGFNVYASGEYRRQEALRSSDRGYPYNTADLSRLCDGSGNPLLCRANGIQNGINADGSYQGLGATQVFVARPYNATNTAAIPGSRYQLINPSLGCRNLTPVTLTAAQAASTAGTTAAINNCQEDLRNEYNLISPSFEQLGGSIRATSKLGENTTFYAMFNYYQNKTNSQGASSGIRAVTTPAASGVTYSTATLALPVYVCAQRVNCTAANGTLNPNNPFAAAGQQARVVGRLDRPTQNEYLTKAYRFASGLNGSFGDDFNYSLDGTYMRETLRATYNNYIFVQNLLDVVADGTFNFRDQSQNSTELNNYVTPELINRSASEVWQVQGSLAKALFNLPGGPLQLGIGAAYRHEMVYAPSANPDSPLGPTYRYFTINPFGSRGKRNVKSAYFELQAPVLTQLEINVSGRYDDYSSGQHNFSPKVGAKFTPIKQVAIRGTYSRGFRIPSFAESGADPTTGFITVNPPAAYCNGAPAKTSYVCDAYSLGLTTVGTPGLKPEKARNFTGGVIVEPLTWLSFSADYYNIKKTNLIAGANYAPAIDAYYAGQADPAGLTTVADVPDTNALNANYKPRLGFIRYGFQNANSLKTSGLDLTGNARVPLGGGLRLLSNIEATYIFKYTTSFSDGSPTQRYDGTLGPYQITSASGTPKWTGNWQNTLDIDGKGSLTATAYYTGGYGEEAEDAGGTRGECGSDPTAVYRDGVTPVRCDVKRFINVDVNAAVNVADNFTLYANVYNVFNAKAPYDPTTYGGYQYNPAWASAGILGRAFSAGARVKF